jgi:hypothetical protein
MFPNVIGPFPLLLIGQCLASAAAGSTILMPRQEVDQHRHAANQFHEDDNSSKRNRNRSEGYRESIRCIDGGHA